MPRYSTTPYRGRCAVHGGRSSIGTTFINQLNEIDHLFNFNEFVHFTGLVLNQISLRDVIYLQSITIPPHIGTLPNYFLSQKWEYYYQDYYKNLKSVTITSDDVVARGASSVMYSNTVKWLAYPNATIYVPANLVDAYKAASGWSDYVNKITAIP